MRAKEQGINRATLHRGAWLALCVSLFFGAMPGCGYSFRTSDNSALQKDGIYRLYVAPLSNNTYRSGVENLLYNALIRAISSYRGVKLTRTEAEADAVLSGTVLKADFTSSATKDISQINRPPTMPSVNFQGAQVATEYIAYLDCSFQVVRRQITRGQRPVAWAATFSRSRPFPASNQLGVYGTTSSLINDSEFDRTLGDLALSMMTDVQESMLARF